MLSRGKRRSKAALIVGTCSAVFYWSRPLGAADDVCRLTVCALTNKQQSCWALPLNLAQLLQHIDNSKQEIGTLEITGITNLDGIAWKQICEKLAFARKRFIRSVRFLSGCSDKQTSVLLQHVHFHSVRVDSPQLYTEIFSAFAKSPHLKELSIHDGQPLSDVAVGLLLRDILPCLERFNLKNTSFESSNSRLKVFQWAENHSTTAACLDDPESPALLDFNYRLNLLRLEMLNRVDLQQRIKRPVIKHSAREQNLVTMIEAGITVLKDWYRATHRPVLQLQSQPHPNPDSDAVLAELSC